MPARAEVETRILKALLRHRGVLKEFAASADIVNEIADQFELSQQQRSATLERIYRKENRIVHSLLWHRQLFRAADSLAKSGLVSRPTATFQLSGKREWMLTEKGLDTVLLLEGSPDIDKESLGVRSFEVQKIVKKSPINRDRQTTIQWSQVKESSCIQVSQFSAAAVSDKRSSKRMTANVRFAG